MKENPPMKGKTMSEETKQKISDKAKERYKDITNHPRYNPNITDEEREKGRNYPEYKEWHNEVFRRDNYTCVCCGIKGGIEAHHIYGYDIYKDLRTNVYNGIVLCEECHKELHKLYGRGGNTWQQFREFLYNKYLQTNNLYFLALIETIDLRLIQLNNKAS